MNALIFALAYAVTDFTAIDITTGGPFDEPKVCVTTSPGNDKDVAPIKKECCPAQSFTAVETGPIEMIDAAITGMCKVKLVVKEGEFGDKVIGTSKTHDGSRPFYFSTPLQVTKGKKYTIQPVIESGDCSWRYLPKQLDSYPGGRSGGYCGNNCYDHVSDFVFRVWCSPTPPPPSCEPVFSKTTGYPLPVIAVNGPVITSNPLLKLFNIPEPLQHSHAYIPKSMPVKNGEALELTCCGKKDCVFFVSLYKCPACGRKDGGLLSTLPGAGWSGNACAPVFGDERHPMVTFSKVVEAGETEKLPKTMGEAYMVIFKLDDAKYLPHPWCPKSNGPHFPLSGGLNSPPACAAKCPKY